MNNPLPKTSATRARVSDIDGVARATIGIVRFDPVAATLDMDARACEIFQAPVDRPGLEVWRDRIHPEDLEMVRTMYQSHVTSLGAELLYRIITSTGETHYVLTRSMSIDHHDPRHPGVLTAIVLEVDPAVGADAVLTQVLDRVSLGFTVVDRDMTIVYVNSRAEHHFAISSADLVGRHLHDALPLTKGSFVDDMHREALASRAPVTRRAPSLFAPGRTLDVTANYIDGAVAFDFRDVTDQVQHTSRLIDSYRSLLDHARYDDLTGVLGRAALLERLAGHLGESPNAAAVLFVDIDDFKAVNDTYGHAAGDLVLRTVAQRMQAHCGPFDVLGRIGGDEFVVGLFARPASGLRSAADRFGADLRAVAAAPITDGHHRIEVSISVGVAHTTGATHLADLLADADTDLYEHKRTR